MDKHTDTNEKLEFSFRKITVFNNAVKISPVRNRSVMVATDKDRNAIFLQFKRFEAVVDPKAIMCDFRIDKSHVYVTTVSLTKEAAQALLAALHTYLLEIDK